MAILSEVAMQQILRLACSLLAFPRPGSMMELSGIPAKG
jgi:hypothetical protein